MSESWDQRSRGIDDNSDRSRIAWRSAAAFTRISMLEEHFKCERKREKREKERDRE